MPSISRYTKAKKKKQRPFLTTLRKLRRKMEQWEAHMSRGNWKVSIAEQAVSSPTKSPPPTFFYLFEHFSYIHWFSSSSFREYSQMCKATSNSNISWSKKWNLHLTAFFNNVQSPFNRKMEQSANRKRKGLIKTHQRRSWRFPRCGKQQRHSPQPHAQSWWMQDTGAPREGGLGWFRGH